MERLDRIEVLGLGVFGVSERFFLVLFPILLVAPLESDGFEVVWGEGAGFGESDAAFNWPVEGEVFREEGKGAIVVVEGGIGR